MKANVFRSSLFLVILTLVSGSLSTFAQAPRQYKPPVPPETQKHERSVREMPPIESLEGFPQNRDGSLPVGENPSHPGVNLGHPGLSYRYVQTFGQTEVGYQTDNYHLNAPGGMFIDSNNNLYVVEDHGYRLLRYNSAGINTLSIGVAGLCVDGLNPNRFCTPRDVATDSSGNIWVATGSRIVKFNSSSVYQTQLPVPSASGGWSPGDDDTHFRSVWGVAVDNANNRLFVADRNNHRVQVYNLVGGNPVYSATIGETGVSGSNNSHFNQPIRLAVNTSGNLFVVDNNNYRIMRCVLSGTWTCAPFGSGYGAIEPRGIFVDSADRVYFLDVEEKRVVRCSAAGACANRVVDMASSQDVAVDSSGNIYAGAYGHSVIRQYNSLGSLLNGEYIGTYHESYFPNGNYIFSPWGVAVAPDGSLYVTEDYGYRLLKFNAAGERQWALGDPGGWSDEEYVFSYLEGKPTIAANGNIYLPDSGNSRIKVYDSNGNHQVTYGGFGTGEYEFDYPMGIAISPLDGDIYVSDVWNHRIQVYDSSFNYETTLGETGVGGDDSTHFNSPFDVAVDANNNIYVADYDNYRLQKCTRSSGGYSCTTFAGISGTIMDYEFDTINPIGVAVDRSGKVYVADDWNNRIMVYDNTGAFLTVIGVMWGSNNGSFRGSVGLTVDEAGNVYVSDWRNNRVQKFSPGVPFWVQKNINGLGNWLDAVQSLEQYNGYLYAGTWVGDESLGDANVWRSPDGSNWSAFTPPWSSVEVVFDIVEFNSRLYFAVASDGSKSGEIWRTDGTSWEQILTDWQGGSTLFQNANVMTTFNGFIYAAAGSWANGDLKIFRSASGDAGTWSPVVSDGFGSAGVTQDMCMYEYNGALYMGIGRYTTSWTAELWKTTDGTAWTPVFTNGLGDSNNTNVSSMEQFGGYLYIGLRNTATGSELWRSPDGSSWSNVFENGLGNPDNQRPYGMTAFDGYLFIEFGNYVTGAEIWRSLDGSNWSQIVHGGWGDSTNYFAQYYDKSAVIYNGNLYYGIMNNGAQGGEIWEFLHKWTFLPIAVR